MSKKLASSSSTLQRSETEADIDLDLPTDEETLIPWFKINYCFLIFYVLSIGCNGICVAYTTGGNN